MCSSHDLKDALHLSSTPLANDFVDSTRLDEEQPVFPLELSYCNNCYHTQLKDVVDPKLLYENYIYVSGTSQTSPKKKTDGRSPVSRFCSATSQSSALPLADCNDHRRAHTTPSIVSDSHGCGALLKTRALPCSPALQQCIAILRHARRRREASTAWTEASTVWTNP